jgi:ribonuclease HIII
MRDMPLDKKPTAPCFVCEINLSLAEKLREDLIAQGFTLTVPAHTIFSAQKKGVSCTLYTSGKLTVQGKDKDEFIRFYLEPEILQSVAYSYPETQVELFSHIGIDESGKGDFFGPLCIAGVYASEEQIKELLKIGVKDSKTLNEKMILSLSSKIKQICPHTIIKISPKRYNELYATFRNLNSLLGWGHATAITELVEKTGCTHVVIDQFASEHVVINAMKKKNVAITLVQKHKAESDPVVAAASILARATYVYGMQQLSTEYGIELPKGASPQVVKAGRLLVSKFGKEVLTATAKLHFKTTSEVLHDSSSSS